MKTALRMCNPFDCNEKNGILEVKWVINNFYLGKCPRSPVFNFQGRKLWLSMNMSISKYFDQDKFNVYLVESKNNNKILQTFEVKGLSYDECFCERTLGMPLRESRELLGSVYRMKVMRAYNRFANICKDWDTMQIKIKLSKVRKLNTNSKKLADAGRKPCNKLNDTKQEMAKVKESTVSSTGKHEKTIDFLQETNSSDVEIDKLEEFQNMIKKTEEYMAQKRIHKEKEFNTEIQELREKCLREAHEESPSFFKVYSLLHDITDTIVKFQSRVFSRSGKLLITGQCMKFANAIMSEESSETGEIFDNILTHFQEFIYQKGTSYISESDVPLVCGFALKYNLEKLLNLCVSYKKENIMSAENVCKLLELAIKYDATKLKNDIISNDCTDGKFMQSEHWLKIAEDNPEIACMGYHNLVKSYSAMFSM